MGNYNTVCENDNCRTKVRKIEKDVYHCKNHRCIKLLCDLVRKDEAHYCEHHT